MSQAHTCCSIAGLRQSGQRVQLLQGKGQSIFELPEAGHRSLLRLVRSGWQHRASNATAGRLPLAGYSCTIEHSRCSQCSAALLRPQPSRFCTDSELHSNFNRPGATCLHIMGRIPSSHLLQGKLKATLVDTKLTFLHESGSVPASQFAPSPHQPPGVSIHTLWFCRQQLGGALAEPLCSSHQS